MRWKGLAPLAVFTYKVKVSVAVSYILVYNRPSSWIKHPIAFGLQKGRFGFRIDNDVSQLGLFHAGDGSHSLFKLRYFHVFDHLVLVKTNAVTVYYNLIRVLSIVFLKLVKSLIHCLLNFLADLA